MITGRLPEGGFDSAQIQVASIPAFIVMKGYAIANRLKEKDAWDIYYIIKNFRGGPAGLADRFLAMSEDEMVSEALKNIAAKFSSPDDVGPVHVVNFEELTDPMERKLLQRDAYEQVRRFLESLGVG